MRAPAVRELPGGGAALRSAMMSDRTVELERGQVTRIGPSRALSEDLDLCRMVLWP
ncbi:MAG TPA: hypothetical protein VKD45_13375 [Hyphomicrobiaceae bacterium]|nr:hypothetical protein [Hyphomicrobiaceae bacterium]